MTDTKFKVLDLIQGTQEWLDARRQHITATEVAHIASGLTSVYTLVGQKLGVVPVKDISDLPPVQEGKHFEPLVRQEVARRFPQLLAAGETDLPQPCCESLEEPFFMASLDGYSARAGIVVEIKNIFSRTREKYEEVKAKGFDASSPRKYGYYWQIQWQLYVTGARQALLFFHYSPDGETFHPENIVAIPVKRDEKAMEKLKVIALEVKDFLDRKALPAPAEGDTVYLTQEESARIAPVMDAYRFIDLAYRQALETVNTLKVKRTALTDRLCSELLHDGIRSVQGEGFSLTRTERRGSFDVEKMIEDGIITAEQAEKYRKAASFTNRLTLG